MAITFAVPGMVLKTENHRYIVTVKQKIQSGMSGARSSTKMFVLTCMEVDVKNPSNNTMGSEDVYLEQ